MVFTSAVGQFEFDEETPMSKCKMIRDSVVGAVMAPPEGSRRVKTEQEAYDYIRDAFGNALNDVKFKFVMS